MATYDFSTPEDEPVIFKFGKGADKVEVDLTFVPPERAFDFVMFVKDTRDKVKAGELTQVEVMAEAIAAVSKGATTPHSIDKEWILKNVKLSPLAKAFSVVYECASGDSASEKN